MLMESFVILEVSSATQKEGSGVCAFPLSVIIWSQNWQNVVIRSYWDAGILNDVGHILNKTPFGKNML